MNVKTLFGLAAAAWLAAGTAHAQISDEVVRIGVLTDLSGPYADLSGQGSVLAAQMAVRDFGGTVAGKKIEIVAADHQNKADIASAIAREWIERDKVDAIADVITSSVALAIQGIARERGKILLMSGPATAELTNKACSPTGVHWTYDSYALAHGPASALVKQGGDSWFFLTVDYALGQALERDTGGVVVKSGGKVVGAVRHPINTTDFSSFLLQAQASKAKIVALANAGADAINAIKQAAEFGLTEGGQRLAGLLIMVSEVESLGLQAAQGLIVTEPFYWDQNDETRAWSKRFMAERKKMPNMIQAGIYGAVTHYLKAIQAAGTDESKAVMAKMRETPINDFMTRNGTLREDGRVMRDMYLYQVKSPAESKYPFDFYKQIAVIPAEQAFRPASESECPLLKKN